MPDFLFRIFLPELLADIIEKDVGSLEFETAVGEADEEEVAFLEDVVDVSE